MMWVPYFNEYVSLVHWDILMYDTIDWLMANVWVEAITSGTLVVHGLTYGMDELFKFFFFFFLYCGL